MEHFFVTGNTSLNVLMHFIWNTCLRNTSKKIEGRCLAGAERSDDSLEKSIVAATVIVKKSTLLHYRRLGGSGAAAVAAAVAPRCTSDKSDAIISIMFHNKISSKIEGL